MKQFFCIMIFCIGFFSVCAQAASGSLEATDYGLKIDYQELWTAESTFRPVAFTVKSRKDSYDLTVRIETKSSRSHTSETIKTVRVTPGETRFLLLHPTIANEYQVKISAALNGSYVIAEEDTNLGTNLWQSRLSFLFVDPDWKVSHKLDQCFERFDKESSKPSTSSSSPSAGTMKFGGSSNTYTEGNFVERIDRRITPEEWQAYAGLTGTLVIAEDSLGKLTAAQMRAIRHYVRFGGGRLWVYGNSPAETLARFGMAAGKRSSHYSKSEIALHNFGLGILVLSSESSLEKMNRSEFDVIRVKIQNSSCPSYSPMLEELNSTRGYNNHNSLTYGGTEPPGLQDGFNSIPVLGYSILSVLLALLIGPINLLVLRRRKRLELFYLTAPAIALIAVFLIGGYSLVHEGFGMKYNETAFLFHDRSGSGTDAAVYHYRGMYTPLAPGGGFSYPAQTLAMPSFKSGSSGTNLVTDWTGRLHMAEGYLNGREASTLGTITPVTLRMGIDYSKRGDQIIVTNNLTAKAEWILLSFKYGRGRVFYSATNVEPGSSVVAKNRGTDPNTYLKDKNQSLRPFIQGNCTLCASMEGLPHLDDGGVSGRLMKPGSYYYISADNNPEIRENVQ